MRIAEYVATEWNPYYDPMECLHPNIFYVDVALDFTVMMVGAVLLAWFVTWMCKAKKNTQEVV